jgi:hypothetical protein
MRAKRYSAEQIVAKLREGVKTAECLCLEWRARSRPRWVS